MKKKNGVTTEANMEGAVYELTFKWDFETMNRFRTVSQGFNSDEKLEFYLKFNMCPTQSTTDYLLQSKCNHSST